MKLQVLDYRLAIKTQKCEDQLYIIDETFRSERVSFKVPDKIKCGQVNWKRVEKTELSHFNKGYKDLNQCISSKELWNQRAPLSHLSI